MTKKRKRNGTYSVAFAGILLATLLIYSCTTDNYEITNEQKIGNYEISQSHTFSSKTRSLGNTLLDSIATSDEFLEFEICTQVVADKFETYTANLNKKQYEILMSHINDDEYIEEVIRNANMNNELKQLNIASGNLLQHTGFLRLTIEERSQLFLMYAESQTSTKQTLLKTRREGGNTDKCEEIKQEAYNQAKKDYDNAVVECQNSQDNTYICYALASAAYNKEKRVADKEYEECIQSSK